jgi:hypothetical protein
MPLATLNYNKKTFFKFLFFEKVSKNQKIANINYIFHFYPSNQIFCFPIIKFKYNDKISKISLNYLYYKIYKYQIFLGWSVIKSKFISGAIHF